MAVCNTPAVAYTSKHGVKKKLQPVPCPALPCNEANLQAFVAQTRIHDFMYGCATLVFGNIMTKDCLFTDHTTAQKHCIKKWGNTDVGPCYGKSTARYRNLTMVQCAKECADKNRAAKVKSVLVDDYLATGLKDVAAKINYYTTDKFVHDPVRKVEQTLCYESAEATDYIIAASCLVGLSFMCAFVIFMGAQKRFNTRYSEEQWPETRESLDSGDTQPLLGHETKN